MPYTLFLYIFVFIFGIFVGSFLNVCIYRLPKNESIVVNASHCMTCGTKIKRYDLIPIFSWLILGGKCRHCKAKISARYPLVEFLNGVMWVIAFLVLDFSVHAILVSLLFSALIVVFFMDLDTQLINTGVVVVIAVLAVLEIIFARQLSVVSYLLGAVVVSVPLFLIHVLTKGQGMGLGDVYLMIAGGLFLGLKGVAVAIFIGLILGSIVGLILKYITKSSRFAFGPYLSVGIAVAALYGEQIFNAYLKLVGLA